MSRSLHKLTAVKVARPQVSGLQADGGGLYLRTTRSGSKSWIFRFSRNGRTRDMGLGPFPAVSLAAARETAAGCRTDLHKGLDPVEERQRKRKLSETRSRTSLTFQQCAEAYISAHETSWRNAKHRNQWKSTLVNYAYPVLGQMDVASIDTEAICKVFQDPLPNKPDGLWFARPETASRLRGRIEVVLDWAKVRGARFGENPARLRGHLDALLPARRKISPVVHHPALPHQQLPPFIRQLRRRNTISANALEFLILTACRTSEVLGAKFSEVDFDLGLWTIPADRMKAGREQRVPLGNRAIEIAQSMLEVRQSGFLFPGAKHGRPLSDMSLLMLTRDLNPGITVHGFRSTFKDWAAEETNFPNFLSEAALAHRVADRVEAAYRRSDLLRRRRELMMAWDQFCNS